MLVQEIHSDTFEGVGVGLTNTGLLLIGEEVIEYTSTTSSTIGGSISRGVTPKSYPIDTPVYKYELAGVSLARINKTHDLNDVTIANPITLDSYHIKLDMSEKLGTIGINDNADRSSGVGSPNCSLIDQSLLVEIMSRAVRILHLKLLNHPYTISLLKEPLYLVK